MITPAKSATSCGGYKIIRWIPTGMPNGINRTIIITPGMIEF
jgi:hypothetical protein